MRLLITFVAVVISCLNQSHADTTSYLTLNRAKRALYLTDDQKIIWRTSVGIGRGGLLQKKNMSDLITPTGTFTVDVILYKDSSYNQISPSAIKKFNRDPEFARLLKDQLGLKQLFTNMNSIDFNKDGKSDNAYGDGYIGLSSSNAVTGPKMTRYHGTIPYWFSIALHGTEDAKENIGAMNSGGCVHLSKEALSFLIENRYVSLGTIIIIEDS